MANYKITNISPQKNVERLNIFLDGTFAFGLKRELVSDFELIVGKELTDLQVATIRDADQLKKCLDKAYHYLSFRPRSEKEVRDKLSEKYETETVDQAILKLKDYNYIDDVAFVKFWLEARGQSRGPQLLKSELIKKGVAKETISEALLDTTEQQMFDDALALITSKSKYKSLTKAEAYKRVAPFLARRGYSYEIIKNVIKEVYPK